MCVCPFLDRYNGGSNTVENPSNAAKELWLSTRTPVWQSVSATVAVLSQSSGIERPFIAMRRVTWYRSAIIAPFTYCCTIIAPFTCCCTNRAVASTAVVTSKRVVNARSVF